MTRTDVVLIHPPASLPSEPPLGAAVLAGQLREAGLGVTLIDANIEALNELLEAVPAAAGLAGKAAQRAIQGRARALETLRSPRGYRCRDRHRAAVATLRRLAALASNSLDSQGQDSGDSGCGRRGNDGEECKEDFRTPCGVRRLDLADYRDARLSPLRSADLLRAAACPEESPLAPYAWRLAERVAALAPRLLGLSVSYLHQALPAMVLAGALRERLGAAVPILLGGPLASAWRGLLAPSGLLPVVDRVVFGSGSGAGAILAALGAAPIWPSAAGASAAAPRICAGTAAAARPGPSPPAGLAPTEMALRAGQRATGLGLPDYAGAAWPLYLSPIRIAPVTTSLGCSWGRCRYCPEAALGPGCTALPAGAVPGLLDRVRAAAGAGLLHLTDSTIPTATLLRLSQERWSARWYGFARLTPELAQPAVCRDLRRSGCVMLQLGLESGSPAILRRLRKGIDLQTATAAIEALADAGIAVYLYVMLGVPGETREDALRTLELIATHAAAIRYLNASLLNLPRASPDEPDLLRVPFSRDQDLSLYTGFLPRSGWDRRKARRFLERELAREPSIAEVLRRTPLVFGANHAPLFELEEAAAAGDAPDAGTA